MQRFLEAKLTVKQMLVVIALLGFSITPWGLLLTQRHLPTPRVTYSPPAMVTVPIASNHYPTLPPIAQLNKDVVFDNHAISRLKTLLNQPSNASPSLSKPNTELVTHNRIDNVTQRCWLDGQSYVAGDIVKTPSGWIRCSPAPTDIENSSNKQVKLTWLTI